MLYFFTWKTIHIAIRNAFRTLVDTHVNFSLVNSRWFHRFSWQVCRSHSGNLMRLSRHSVFSCRINAASVSLHPRDCDTGDPASVFPAGRSPEGVRVLSLYSASHCSIKMHVARVTVTYQRMKLWYQRTSHLMSLQPSHGFLYSWVTKQNYPWRVVIFLVSSGLRTASLPFVVPCLLWGISQIKSV